MLKNESINGLVNREVDLTITGKKGEFTGIQIKDIEGVELVKKKKEHKTEGFLVIVDNLEGYEEGKVYRGKTVKREDTKTIIRNEKGELREVKLGVEVLRITRTKRNGKNMFGVLVDGRIREVDKKGKNDLKRLIGKGIELYTDDKEGLFTLEELSEYCNGLGLSTEVTVVPKSKTQNNPEGEKRLSIRGRDLKYVFVNQSEEGVENHRVGITCKYKGGTVQGGETKWYYKYGWYTGKGVKGIANEIYKLAQKEVYKG